MSRLSIIIPAYNEVESLPGTHSRVVAVLDELSAEAEIIYVDDGSNDGTLEVMHTLRETDPRVKVIGFRKNQGKSAALAVAFTRAQGEIIITLDADGQDEPQEIHRMLEKLDEGYDVVVGWKYPRNDPPMKVIPSRLFNAVVSRSTGISLHDMNCGLKVMRREVTESVSIYGELHRFLVPIAHLKGFRCTELPVQHHPREFGKSKFGATRYMEGAFDLVTILFLSHFQVRPMHLFGSLGVLLFLGGSVINTWLAVQWFLGVALGNRPLLFLGILMSILGVQLFCTGLIGEMLARFASRRMEYPIREELGWEIPKSSELGTEKELH